MVECHKEKKSLKESQVVRYLFFNWSELMERWMEENAELFWRKSRWKLGNIEEIHFSVRLVVDLNLVRPQMLPGLADFQKVLTGH